MRYALGIEYDGSRYCGWQRQKNVISVQQKLEEALSKIANEPIEVICHGDFAPYNVALTDNEVMGVFDFDTAHPAPRVWDLAYAVYCWAPFKSNNDDSLGEISDQIERAVLFCNAYQATEQQREELVTTMIARLQALLNFMKQQANEGNTQFQQNLDDGHHLSYEKDIEYLIKNRQLITKQLLA